MLQTVDFIRNHGLAELTARYAISVKRHGKYPNLVHLKYSQIESPMGEPIAQECRGLILDEGDDWRVVAYPYRKFFNHGEGHAAPIDWATAQVNEKLDGSLMTVYRYSGAWHVSSSGLPDAAGPAHVGALTFAELFWRTWESLAYQMPLYRDCCYMFELMTPHNRVIVHHVKPRIVLHGVRDIRTFEELDPAPVAAAQGWECVRSFPLTSFDECLSAAATLKPMECEGYVVRDAAFNRVKVKSPQYVALAHLKEGCSGRRLLEIVRTNESDEFLGYFPEFRPAYETVRTAFDELCAGLEAQYEAIKSIPVQKDFAAEAIKTRCSGALFSLRAGKSKSVREYLAACSMQAAERTLGLNLEELLAGELDPRRSDSPASP